MGRMMNVTELWIDKNNFRNKRSGEAAPPKLRDGDVRVAIDKFAITSNNVGYAFSGEMIGYWRFFPTGEEPWGKVRSGAWQMWSKATHPRSKWVSVCMASFP